LKPSFFPTEETISPGSFSHMNNEMAGTGILNQNNFTNAGMSQLSISDQILIMRLKLEYFINK
jgi:hypothetical protein